MNKMLIRNPGILNVDRHLVKIEEQIETLESKEILTDIEKDYIESFMERLNATTVFEGKKCLCHNDFSCNHLLLDGNNRLTGIIDFGDSGIIDEYCDFIYLLEDSEEEIGTNFGEDILRMYGNIDIEKAKEYQDIVEEYYPIETIVYGIKNIKQEFIENQLFQLIYYCHLTIDDYN